MHNMNRLNDIIEMILITLSDLLYFNLIVIIIISKIVNEANLVDLVLWRRDACSGLSRGSQKMV